MDSAVTEAVTDCLHTVQLDEPWQDFGFPKRPRYGVWFQRFRPKWRLDLEKTVLQQMLSVLTAAYVIAGKLPKESIDISVAAYLANVDVSVYSLGFSSQADGASRLKEAIEEYASSLPERWPEILCTHIRPDLLPDKKLAARLFLGCTKFGTSTQDMINVLKVPI
jgi:hypothetical protein